MRCCGTGLHCKASIPEEANKWLSWVVREVGVVTIFGAGSRGVHARLQEMVWMLVECGGVGAGRQVGMPVVIVRWRRVWHRRIHHHGRRRVARRRLVRVRHPGSPLRRSSCLPHHGHFPHYVHYKINSIPAKTQHREHKQCMQSLPNNLTRRGTCWKFQAAVFLWSVTRIYDLEESDRLKSKLTVPRSSIQPTR